MINGYINNGLVQTIFIPGSRISSLTAPLSSISDRNPSFISTNF